MGSDPLPRCRPLLHDYLIKSKRASIMIRLIVSSVAIWLNFGFDQPITNSTAFRLLQAVAGRRLPHTSSVAGRRLPHTSSSPTLLRSLRSSLQARGGRVADAVAPASHVITYGGRPYLNLQLQPLPVLHMHGGPDLVALLLSSRSRRERAVLWRLSAKSWPGIENIW